MKTPFLTPMQKLSLAVLAVGLSTVCAALADTLSFIGTNGVSASVNWSDTANWIKQTTTTLETPANNMANFNYNTMAAAAGIVTLNVDGAYGSPGSGTPQAWGMFFTQTNGFQTVTVQP